MNEFEDRLQRLSSALFPPDTPLHALPVDGYRPPSAQWRPRQAAVLVPIELDPEPALILTIRSHALKSHAGQVAFPGGARDGSEDFPLQTALREAQEEVGIDPAQVRVLGLMRCFDTISAYRVVPVVGVVRTAVQVAACPHEVKSVFRLPLSEALEPAAYRRHWLSHRQREHELWSMRSARWPIWGATAAMLSHLAELAVASHKHPAVQNCSTAHARRDSAWS